MMNDYNYNNYIETQYFGFVPIRKTYTVGKTLACIQLADGDNAEIRSDYTSGQFFAVLFDGDWQQK